MCICPADCSRIPQLPVMPWIPEGCQSWCSALLLLGTAGHLPCKQDKHLPSAKQARNHSLSLYGHGNSSEHQEGFGLLKKEEGEIFWDYSRYKLDISGRKQTAFQTAEGAQHIFSEVGALQV